MVTSPHLPFADQVERLALQPAETPSEEGCHSIARTGGEGRDLGGYMGD
mgnify:CR=1 FL=1